MRGALSGGVLRGCTSSASVLHALSSAARLAGDVRWLPPLVSSASKLGVTTRVSRLGRGGGCSHGSSTAAATDRAQTSSARSAAARLASTFA